MSRVIVLQNEQPGELHGRSEQSHLIRRIDREPARNTAEEGRRRPLSAFVLHVTQPELKRLAAELSYVAA